MCTCTWRGAWHVVFSVLIVVSSSPLVSPCIIVQRWRVGVGPDIRPHSCGFEVLQGGGGLHPGDLSQGGDVEDMRESKAGSLAQLRRLRCWLSEGVTGHTPLGLWAENLVDPSGKARVLCCRAGKPERGQSCGW